MTGGRITDTARLVVGADLNWILRKRSYVVNQAPTSLLSQMRPGRHGRSGHAPGDSPEQVFIRGSVIPGGNQPEFRQNEVARFWVEQIRGRPLPVPFDTMAGSAILFKGPLA